MTSVGEALVAGLKARGVEVVFGIPGVHTVELYRGLPRSGIRHVTPRHEAGAGFMADGYARVSGKPGVAFVITGPGVTNILTPMGQARADSVPMLVVSGVNARDTLGLGLGHLHELPDQRGMVAKLALLALRISDAGRVAGALDQAFAALTSARGGPVHLEVPIDVMPLPCPALPAATLTAATLPALAAVPAPPQASADLLHRAAALLAAARRPVILAGGGARHAEAALQALATRIAAPVVQTVNARGLMHRHPLSVAASPSLEAVRALIGDADLVLAVGTEFGPTDYDMYGRGNLPAPPGMIRIDIDAAQLGRRRCGLALQADAAAALAALAALVPARHDPAAATRAATARTAAWAEIGPAMQHQVAMLAAMRDACPGSIIVGDSTQPVYAGNLCYDHDRPGGWFNAATGFGALGYGAPAAVGAAIAAPDATVICLTGDGGLQFSLAELLTAKDEGLAISFVVWNNHGYREIAEAMAAAGAQVLGCNPTPPLFGPLAAACGLRFVSVSNDPAALGAALAEPVRGPRLIEIRVD